MRYELVGSIFNLSTQQRDSEMILFNRNNMTVTKEFTIIRETKTKIILSTESKYTGLSADSVTTVITTHEISKKTKHIVGEPKSSIMILSDKIVEQMAVKWI